VLGPDALEAVTRTRNVEPTSADTTAYDELVAPPMSPQPEPPQRCHRYANDDGAFVHPPDDPLNDCPTTADPDTTGTDVFTGTPEPPATEYDAYNDICSESVLPAPNGSLTPSAYGSVL